ncbi:MAG: hypothetical protein KF893_01125 [Caldilineaceae bacterium]|nr:hypothetical protein [Caldilineaceae bacterium]
MSDKLINTFHFRRKLNAAIEALGETSSETELLEQVRAIIRTYDPELILTVLRKFLDNSSSQLRGGLGRLATLLPYEEVVTALRHDAANRNNPTQARLTAALILERFLHAEIPPALMSDLKDPEVVVMQSLQEAIAEGKQNRYVLLDYVRQMRQESEDVALMVINLIEKLPPEDRPELLRLITYDMRVRVAKSALERLSALRQPTIAPRAAEILFTLSLNLSPDLADLAERNLRKLRFSGVVYDPPPISEWRALLTPCTLNGEQDLWFLRSNRKSGTIIGIHLDNHGGVKETFGSEDVETLYMPPKRQIGEMISIAVAGNTPYVFLEAPVAYARWHLSQILDRHWQQQPRQPLPDEYTLHNFDLFRHAKPQLDPALADLLASGPTLWAAEGTQLEQIAAEFLRHPAMSGWFFQEQSMKEALLRTSHQQEPVNLVSLLTTLMTKMFEDDAAEPMMRRLQTALRAQAGWLLIAGHERNAQYAMLLAESFEHVPLHQHPLTALMVEIGLMLTLNRRTIH